MKKIEDVLELRGLEFEERLKKLGHINLKGRGEGFNSTM